jgi:hypothetical protein
VDRAADEEERDVASTVTIVLALLHAGVIGLLLISQRAPGKS